MLLVEKKKNHHLSLETITASFDYNRLIILVGKQPKHIKHNLN